MSRRRRAGWLAILAFGIGSVGVNVGLVYSLSVLCKGTPPEPPEPPELITYLELQPDAPETERVEEPDPPKPPPPPVLPKPRKPVPKAKLPKIEFEELPEPEKEKEPEPEPEPEPEAPAEPVELILEQLKMVEQPDELDEKDAPKQFDYLSNVNRDVLEQTRAAVTNLEKDALQAKAAQLEPSADKKPGTAAKEKIAQQREQPAAAAKSSPPAPASPVEERPKQDDPKPQSLLAMRNVEHRDHHMAQDAHEALAEEAATGTLQRDQKKEASIAKRDAQARIDKNDPTYRFRPRPKDLIALFGKDKNAPQRPDGSHESKTKGVWEDVRAHYQSPLENMVSEVKIGNQTALRSRKHPFARFIAQMHREIHDAWAWGFLEQLDMRGSNHPLNKFDLWSRVEVVLDRNGNIEKVSTVRHSGNLAFDAAAREVIHSSGPFPEPPAEIRSGNGKIYLHWAFHRDERACGTFGASPFILDNAGAGDRPDPDAVVRGSRGEQESLGRRLAKPKAQRVPEGPQLPGGSAHGPGDGHNHGGGGSPEGEAEPGGPGESGGEPPAAADPHAGDVDAEDPEAGKLANEWLHYFALGEIERTAARSSLPFSAGDEVAARSKEELRDVLQTMHTEAKAAGKPKAAKVYTAAGLRKVFGSVPAGVQEGTGKLYALTKVGSDYVILMLEKKFGSWRVVGISR